jgi:hypothetical protein
MIVRLWKLEVPDIAFDRKLGMCSPQQNTSCWVVIRDAIKKVKGLFPFPNKLSLKLRDLNLAFLDITDKVFDECRGGFKPSPDVWLGSHGIF